MSGRINTPARVVATALQQVDGKILGTLVMTEDSETTYNIEEDDVDAAWLAGVLDAFGAPAWEELRGRTVFAVRDVADGPVVGLAHLPTEPGGEFMFPDTVAELGPSRPVRRARQKRATSKGSDRD